MEDAITHGRILTAHYRKKDDKICTKLKKSYKLPGPYNLTATFKGIHHRQLITTFAHIIHLFIGRQSHPTV